MYPYDYATAGSTQPFVVLNKDLSRGQWWRAELNATKVFWEDHKITVGTEYQGNFDQYQTNYDLTTLLESKERTYKWAALVQDEYTINSKLSLNAGVRLDYFSVFGYSINPRAGLVYQPWSGSTVKLLYGSAFRAPNEYEEEYYSTYDGQPNPNLKPETLDTYELVFEHYFNTHLRSEIDLFRTEINGIITLTNNSSGFLQNQNHGNVESQGLELQLEDSWGNGFQGRLSYSWQQTVDKTLGSAWSTLRNTC